MTKSQLTVFLGWCSVLNIGLLGLSAFFLIVLGDLVRPLHSFLLSMPESDLNQLYANWIAGFKVLVIVFNVVPYLALKLMKEA